jgi:GDP-L-fucose synthase
VAKRFPKLLLTGAHGMVGRNLQEHPSAAAYRLLTPRSDELNLLDATATLEYLRTHLPDIVVHAAGKVGGIQANIKAPVEFLLHNMDIGRNIVWGARQVGIRRLLNLGSSCMYPRGYEDPLAEELILKGELEPTNEGYALAKVATARLCDYIVREDSNFQYRTLIPCNLYGRFDKFDVSHSHLLPAIIVKVHQAMLRGEAEVEIWGDGLARREFMYAGDLADAIYRAVADFDVLPQYMNIGLGVDYSVNDYYATVASVMGWRGRFRHDLGRPVGMARKLVSTARQQAWGWSPHHSLEQGIRKTLDFYLKEARI